MRRIKTYARSVMTEERFSDLALISMHLKERVPADEICKAFVQAHPRKLFQASLFDDCSTSNAALTLLGGCSVIPGRAAAMFFGVSRSVTECFQSVTDYLQPVTELGTPKNMAVTELGTPKNMAVTELGTPKNMAVTELGTPKNMAVALPGMTLQPLYIWGLGFRAALKARGTRSICTRNPNPVSNSTRLALKFLRNVS